MHSSCFLEPVPLPHPDGDRGTKEYTYQDERTVMYTIVESLYRTPETHVTQCTTHTGIDMKNLIRKNIVKKKKRMLPD